jgi:hypothetical protein
VNADELSRFTAAMRQIIPESRHLTASEYGVLENKVKRFSDLINDGPDSTLWAIADRKEKSDMTIAIQDLRAAWTELNVRRNEARSGAAQAIKEHLPTTGVMPPPPRR